MRGMAGTIFSLLLLFTGAAFGQARDQIVRKTEGPILAEVISESYDKVVYEQGGKEAEVPAQNVQDIIYSDTPDAYYTAEELRAQGDYENAIKSFRLAQNAGEVRPWVQEYTRYQIAECHRRWGPGHYDDAIAAYQELIAQHPQTRFLAPALYGIGQSQLVTGLASAATETFDRLEREASSKRLGEVWVVRARFQKGWAELAAKQFGPARNTFASAASLIDSTLSRVQDLDPASRQELESLQVSAKLAEGDSYLAEEQYDRAESFFKSLLGGSNGSSSIALKAGATNGIGECLYHKKQYEEARLEFTRANVLYRGSDEQTARSLYWLGKCVEALQEPRWQSKQESYWNELRERYPDSRWTQELTQ